MPYRVLVVRAANESSDNKKNTKYEALDGWQKAIKAKTTTRVFGYSCRTNALSTYHHAVTSTTAEAEKVLEQKSSKKTFESPKTPKRSQRMTGLTNLLRWYKVARNCRSPSNSVQRRNWRKKSLSRF